MTDARTLQRQIHVACRQLGLDADLRHDIQLSATGKASLRDMDEADLRKVISALEQRGFKGGFKGTGSGLAKGRRQAADRADVRFLHVLWRLLSEAGAVRKPGREGLNAFVRSRFGASWGAEVIDIDALRDACQINDVTRALKDMCRRAGVEVR